MTKPEIVTAPAGALDALAAQADTLAAQPLPGEGTTELDLSERQEQEREAADMAAAQQMMEGVAVGLVHGGLKFVRGQVAARGLPEIEGEWTDATLQPAAASSLPLIKKHMGKLMDAMAEQPELAVLFMGLLPLALGVVNALQKHAANAKKPEAAPEPSAA